MSRLSRDWPKKMCVCGICMVCFYSLRGFWHPNIQHSPFENLGCKISNQPPMKSVFHRLVYKLQKRSKSWDLQVALTSHLDQRYLTRKVIDRHHLELITKRGCIVQTSPQNSRSSRNWAYNVIFFFSNNKTFVQIWRT